MSTSMLTLKSSDGQEFNVEESVILQSLTIKNMVEDDCDKDKIPLPNVDGKCLAKGIEYCNAHANPGSEEEDIKEFDKEIARLGDNEEFGPVFDLLLAANYLNIWGLLDKRSQRVADMMIKEEQPQEIRNIFGIENDFMTKEEEELNNQAIDLPTMHAHEEEVHS
ncbi:hypothetical protein RJ640_007145 [Escallonia rubra]|uniref:SKP1-like protein n=1 Tax=Escallonia rubra TaxID=112253 RepID=A0AA88QR13_9ASTE|nr:hypothetical protein RJ640_007145 [Escallonia rubra]